jgi:D-alanyl-lipoteichoic acid acyltransferase DltB (MBOAT superfamily)
MLFSSPIFLFLFLPVVLALCALPGLKLRNGLLLIFSVIFYAWGEVLFVFLMLGSALLNHFLGQWVDRETDPARRKWAVGVAVALNIGTLAFFKYANISRKSFTSGITNGTGGSSNRRNPTWSLMKSWSGSSTCRTRSSWPARINHRQPAPRGPRAER